MEKRKGIRTLRFISPRVIRRLRFNIPKDDARPKRLLAFPLHKLRILPSDQFMVQ
jgi:hypothetical protein